MANKEEPDRENTHESPPTELPQTPPPQPVDWSWSLQSIMELQKTVGALSKSVETLAAQAEKHDRKLDQISHRIYAAVAVLAVVGGVLAWILNAASDEVVAVVMEALLRSPTQAR